MSQEAYGVEVTPEMIAELLDKGQIHVDKGDTRIYLSYDTIPRDRTEGWNE